jgi:hypothetical protein
MAGPDQAYIRWRKSTASADGGDCVEIAFADGSIIVRSSRDPHGSMLSFTRQAWMAFLEGASNGEFTPGPADDENV